MLVSGATLLVPFLANLVLNFGEALSIILVACLVFALIHAGLAWYGWNNTLFLLTNQRVVWLHQKKLLNREFSECSLGSIQQVSHELKGLLHTVMGYGNIQIHTGGSQKPFELPNLPDPYELQQEIQRAANGETAGGGEFEEEDV